MGVSSNPKIFNRLARNVYNSHDAHLDLAKSFSPNIYSCSFTTFTRRVLRSTGMGAQRWINLGFINLQPSEVAKVALVMLMAAYYDWLPTDKVSKPLWVLVPVIFISLPVLLVLQQPDLGTSILLLISGVIVMFLAGVHWVYFGTVIALTSGFVIALFKSRGTEWQLLQDYQFLRIDTFLDPDKDPLGAGYHLLNRKLPWAQAAGLGEVSWRELSLA